MNKWLQPTVLKGSLVSLEPLAVEHLQGLIEAAKDGNLWELFYTSVPKNDQTEDYINTAINEFNEDRSLPFVVIENKDKNIIGTTRYMNADPKNKRLEIGTTWYSRSYQRTGVNTESKYLLLEHAFEHLNCIAVEFRTHSKNIPSRNAILRLGAKQDGILRQHSIDRSGNYRDTMVYSILNSEWKTIKQTLNDKIDSYNIM